MEIEIHRETKFAAIWLTKDESGSKEFMESLKPIYADMKKQKIRPVVFISGDQNLYECTSSLLKHNIQ